jgi:hypothetical protein
VTSQGLRHVRAILGTLANSKGDQEQFDDVTVVVRLR